jgi:hypothetical protein
MGEEPIIRPRESLAFSTLCSEISTERKRQREKEMKERKETKPQRGIERAKKGNQKIK